MIGNSNVKMSEVIVTIINSIKKCTRSGFRVCILEFQKFLIIFYQCFVLLFLRTKDVFQVHDEIQYCVAFGKISGVGVFLGTCKWKKC